MPATGILLILLAVFVLINLFNGNLPDLFTKNATITHTPAPTVTPTPLDGGTNHPPTKGPF